MWGSAGNYVYWEWVAVKCNMKTEVEQSEQSRADEARLPTPLSPSPLVEIAGVGSGQTAPQLGEREV